MEELLLHPPLVHFAIVLPMLALLFQIIYSLSNNYIYSQWSAAILVMGAVAMAAAWFTGGTEAQDAYALLSQKGQEVLNAHKMLGFYLMLLSLFLAAIKLYAGRVRNVLLETIVLIGLFALSTGLSYQGLMGGEVVYKYGTSVEKHPQN